MKYGASSSILILDFDMEYQRFRVMNRIEIPKSEYTYDNAINMIVQLNAIYNPSWIYIDRGSGKIFAARRRNVPRTKRAKSVKANLIKVC